MNEVDRKRTVPAVTGHPIVECSRNGNFISLYLKKLRFLYKGGLRACLILSNLKLRMAYICLHVCVYVCATGVHVHVTVHVKRSEKNLEEFVLSYHIGLGA